MKKTSFFSEYDISWASALEHCIKIEDYYNTAHNSLQCGTCALFTPVPHPHPQQKTYMYVTIHILDQYWIKINTMDNYLNWLHMELTSFLKLSQIGGFTGIVLSFTQSVSIPIRTYVISFHDTIYVATLPVLISYKCKYIWTWFKHMLRENTQGYIQLQYSVN